MAAIRQAGGAELCASAGACAPGLAPARPPRARPRRSRLAAAAEEELVAETVAFSVTGALGIDTGAYSVAYLASWSQGADLATVQATAALIDRLARRIERAVMPDVDSVSRADAV